MNEFGFVLVLYYILFSLIQLSPITSEPSNDSSEGPLLPVGNHWTIQPKYKIKQTLLFLSFKEIYIYIYMYLMVAIDSF